MNSSINSSDDNLNLYFDNAATSWPKPEAVYLAAEKQMRSAAGNPGRSGHTRTLEADRLIYKTREAVAALFNVKDPARIVFTFNATDSLNVALKGFALKGDHVIHTAMDHNSVLRPLGRLRNDGIVTTTALSCDLKGLPKLDSLDSAYNSKTRLLIINHASNVTGTIAPIEEMITWAHDKNIAVLIDASQSAGTIPIDVEALDIDMLAFTGHKSLLGPTGTGGLYVKQGLDLSPLREGGTGSQSELDSHPESMPERLEAGTMNSSGLAGLLEGVKFIIETGLDQIRVHETFIRKTLYENLDKLPGIKLYGPGADEDSSCIVSFTIEGADSGEIGYILENNYSILSRTGLHCAPLAHKAIKTFPEGTIRLSPGYFTKLADIEFLVNAIEEITTLVRN